eukprot:TCALIF_02327-PA protein Name:"Protein of unknown function" AED:0.36 eAED:0.36 QI:0/0/0.33/0.33/1/1/3/148/60
MPVNSWILSNVSSSDLLISNSFSGVKKPFRNPEQIVTEGKGKTANELTPRWITPECVFAG